MKTKAFRKKETQGKWHLIDARGQVLGRVAVKIAGLLSGKGEVGYTPNAVTGDYVVVVNAALFEVTGKKEDRKRYYRYTGFPGGLRSETLGKLRQRRPEEIIRMAVSGMLSRNRLHDRRMSRLFIYKGESHPHAAQTGGKNADS